MTKIEFRDMVNKRRLENKNSWIYGCEEVCECSVLYKAYNTWIQILEINGIRCSNPCDQKVSDYKNFIMDSLDKCIH